MATSFRSRLLAQRALMHRLRQPQRRNPLQAGFTLIELLIVVIIIGILASIALPAFLNQRERAEIEGAKSEARSFINACIATNITGDGTPIGPDGSANCPNDADLTTAGNIQVTSSANTGSRTCQVAITSGGGITGVTCT